MSQATILTGPERRRRWSGADRRQLLAAAFAPGANVRDISRRYDVATSLIYKWRRQALTAEPLSGFAELVIAPTEASSARVATAMMEIEVAGRVQVRLPTTTPPALASAIVKALGVR